MLKQWLCVNYVGLTRQTTVANIIVEVCGGKREFRQTRQEFMQCEDPAGENKLN